MRPNLSPFGGLFLELIMVLNKKFNDGLKAIMEIASQMSDIQITITQSGYEVHWKTIVVKFDSVEAVAAAITAFQTLENLGADDF
jgi:hypothetical protein